jgi:hypothetical protein
VLAIQHTFAKLTGLQFDDNIVDTPEDDGDRRTVWVDIHTRLGGFRWYSVLTKVNNKDDDKRARGGRGNRSHAAWMAELAFLLDGAGHGVPPIRQSWCFLGVKCDEGILNGDVLCLLPRCMGVTQEFGTRPAMAVATALVLENAGYHSKNSGRRAHANYLMWAFYPQRLGWRRMMLRGGVGMLHAILDF